MGYGGANAFQALGQGLMGFGQAVGDKRRQSVLDARQSAIDDEARRARELGLALEFAQAGGGPGAAPSIDRPVMAVPEPVDLGASLVGGRGLSGEAQAPFAKAASTLIPEPELGGMEVPTVSRTDPRYMNISDGSQVVGHLDRPGYADQQAALARAAADDIYNAEVPPALDRVMNGTAGGSDIAALERHGVTYENLIPEPAAGPDENIERAKWYISHGYAPPGSAPIRTADADTGPDPSEVRQWLARLTADYTVKDQYGDSRVTVDPGVLSGLARLAAAGEDITPLLPERYSGNPADVGAPNFPSASRVPSSARPALPIPEPIVDTIPAPARPDTTVGPVAGRETRAADPWQATTSPNVRPFPAGVAPDTAVGNANMTRLTRPPTSASEEVAPDTTVGPAPAPAPPYFDESQIPGLQQALIGMPLEEAVTLLREEGADDDQIRLILKREIPSTMSPRNWGGR